MDKKIIITGRTNVKKFTQSIPKREVSKTWNLDDTELAHKEQITCVNKLCLQDTFLHQTIYQREIRNKKRGYLEQDKKKQLYNADKFVTIEHMIDLLVASKLQCYYCRKPVFVLYKNVRDNAQWTLDRIDNNIGHTIGNCVICCLRCNIQRRTMNDEKFRFSKQVRVIKSNTS